MTTRIRKMPKKIKIGFFEFTISKMLDEPDNDSIGITDHDNLEIKIDTSYPDQIVKETLLHECLHAILADSMIVDEQLEEKIILRLSPMIMAMMAENKDLKRYLFD